MSKLTQPDEPTKPVALVHTCARAQGRREGREGGRTQLAFPRRSGAARCSFFFLDVPLTPFCLILQKEMMQLLGNHPGSGWSPRRPVLCWTVDV